MKKQIKLKSLELENFKGIKSFAIDAFGEITNIEGANRAGKSTLYDAFTWLLFGKSADGRSDFGIKTTDEAGNIIEKIDHRVTATIAVDGDDNEISRTLREKWTTKRGLDTAEFTGHETIYAWDGIVISAGEFKTRISDIIGEPKFMLLTNIFQFNSMNWKDQREVLTGLIGDVNDSDVIDGNKDFESVRERAGKKSVSEYGEFLKQSISRSKKELKQYPTRIDEVKHSIQGGEKDWESIENQIKSIEKETAELEKSLRDAAEADKQRQEKKRNVQEEIHKLKTGLSDLHHRAEMEAKKEFQKQDSQGAELKADMRTKERSLEREKNELAQLNREIHGLKVDRETCMKSMDDLRQKWSQIKGEELKTDQSTKCPTCNRAFDEDDLNRELEEMKARFEKDKTDRLRSVQDKGITEKAKSEELSRQIDAHEKEAAEIAESIDELDAAIEKIKAKLDKKQPNKTEEEIRDKKIAEYDDGSVAEKIKELEENIANEDDTDNSEITSEIATKQSEIKALEKQLSERDQIEKAEKRIEELVAEESKMAAEVAGLEKDMFIISKITKAKIDLIESKINEKFEIVNFKLFDTQVNGAIVETCTATVNGVAYADLNTEAKVNAGLDIIRTLSNEYDVSAPIFIDNRESVTEILDVDAQIVNLIVNSEYKNLNIKIIKQ